MCACIQFAQQIYLKKVSASGRRDPLLCSSAVQFNPEGNKLQRRSLDQPSASLSHSALCLDLFVMTNCVKLEHDENKILMHAMGTVFGTIYLFHLVLSVAAGVSPSDTNCWETT